MILILIKKKRSQTNARLRFWINIFCPLWYFHRVAKTNEIGDSKEPIMRIVWIKNT